jgi:hypothetical protein
LIKVEQDQMQMQMQIESAAKASPLARQRGKDDAQPVKKNVSQAREHLISIKMNPLAGVEVSTLQSGCQKTSVLFRELASPVFAKIVSRMLACCHFSESLFTAAPCSIPPHFPWPLSPNPEGVPRYR